MTVEKIDVSSTINKAKELLKKEKCSPALRVAFELLIQVITILLNQKNLNSTNSSKPPSQDPNRPRKPRKDKGKKRKPGGQKGHQGATLNPVEKPDEVEQILIDRRSLPEGDYTSVGFDKRQVFE